MEELEEIPILAVDKNARKSKGQVVAYGEAAKAYFGKESKGIVVGNPFASLEHLAYHSGLVRSYFEWFLSDTVVGSFSLDRPRLIAQAHDYARRLDAMDLNWLGSILVNANARNVVMVEGEEYLSDETIGAMRIKEPLRVHLTDPGREHSCEIRAWPDE